MTKKTRFIKLIICEYRFYLNSQKKLNEREKRIRLLGMRRAWNLINPNDPIEKSEIEQTYVNWKSKDAHEWYEEYRNPSDEDPIESRFDILDIRPLDE